MNANALLSLLYLSGPTLPIGAFAYSQGLAAAIEFGWVQDERSLAEWMFGVLEHGLGALDLPILFRAHAAASAREQETLAYWDEYLQASRETAELLQEELHLGAALRRLLQGQKRLPDFSLPKNLGFVAMFAVAAVQLGVNATEAAHGMAWSWAENQVSVACKAIPLGQTPAQGVLLQSMERIAAAVNRAQELKDHELGGALPGVALASSLHETQYSRLFRS